MKISITEEMKFRQRVVEYVRFASSSASMVGKNRLVFARADYADDAVALADAHGLALFIERQGADMVPVNGRAQGLLLARRGAVPPPTASPYTAPGPLPVAAAPVPPPSSLTPVVIRPDPIEQLLHALIVSHTTLPCPLCFQSTPSQIIMGKNNDNYIFYIIPCEPLFGNYEP